MPRRWRYHLPGAVSLLYCVFANLQGSVGGDADRIRFKPINDRITKVGGSHVCLRDPAYLRIQGSIACHIGIAGAPGTAVFVGIRTNQGGGFTCCGVLS